MMKMNCWEFKKCGRQVGGEKVKELCVCIAAQETRVNGVNSGKNGGRCCYALAGTLCGGKVQGSFVSKVSNCVQCNVYQAIAKEEGAKIKKTMEILALCGR